MWSSCCYKGENVVSGEVCASCEGTMVRIVLASSLYLRSVSLTQVITPCFPCSLSGHWPVMWLSSVILRCDPYGTLTRLYIITSPPPSNSLLSFLKVPVISILYSPFSPLHPSPFHRSPNVFVPHCFVLPTPTPLVSCPTCCALCVNSHTSLDKVHKNKKDTRESLFNVSVDRQLLTEPLDCLVNLETYVQFIPFRARAEQTICYLSEANNLQWILPQNKWIRNGCSSSIPLLEMFL